MRWLPWLAGLVAVIVAFPAVAGDPVLAVMPFTAHTVREVLAVLGPALADMLTTDLAAGEGITLVERSRLDAVVAELKLQESDFIDPATAVAVGRGVGATAVIVGGLSVSGDRLRLDARVVDVASGTVVHAVEAEGATDAVFDLERELAQRVLEAIGAERAGLGAGWATEEPLVWGYKLSTGKARALEGFDEQGVGFRVVKTGAYPPGWIWVDGVSIGQPLRKQPAEIGVRPGIHEVAWTRDSGGHVIKCFGTLEVGDGGLSLKSGELCDALQAGVSPYGSHLEGALLSFDKAGGVSPSYKIDGTRRVLFSPSDVLNLAPGQHRVLLTDGEWIEDEEGRKKHIEHTLCHGQVTVEPGERRAVLVSENGCSGLDESGAYSR